jgi:hypothetical protein
MRHHDFNSDEESGEQVQVLLEGKNDQDRYIEMVEAGIASQQIKQRTLEIAVSVAQKDWLWRFRSPEKKLERILDIYGNLLAVL